MASLAVAAFWLNSATAFAALGLALALTAKVSGLPQRTFWRSLRPLLAIAAFTLLAGAFLTSTPTTPFQLGFTYAGLHKGALYAARLLLITLFTTLFFLTTKPDDAISLGVRLMAPLKLIGIEAKELSLLVHLAYRFVPLLSREVEEMRRGRQARNLTPERGPLARLRETADTIVTIIIGALHRAEVTAMAMEQRGVLEHWKPAAISRGRPAGLWPLILLAALTAGLLSVDGRLL